MCSFRYLLQFGEASHYLGYNAMLDFFPKMPVKPNPECEEYFCIERQKEEAERRKNAKPVVEEAKPEEEPVVHEDNDWGISLVDEDDSKPEEAGGNLQLVEGVQARNASRKAQALML